jgi:hypothetical protein
MTTPPKLFDSTSVNEEGYAIRFPSGRYADYHLMDPDYCFDEVELSHCRFLSGARIPPILQPRLRDYCAALGYDTVEVVRVTRTTTTATTVEPSVPGLLSIAALK